MQQTTNIQYLNASIYLQYQDRVLCYDTKLRELSALPPGSMLPSMTKKRAPKNNFARRQTPEKAAGYSFKSGRAPTPKPNQDAAQHALSPRTKAQNELPAKNEKQKISFVTTTQCVQNCIYCFAPSATPAKQLSIEAGKSILNESVQKGDELTIKFFGGEPSLNMPFIEAMAAHVPSIGARASYEIVTGGYMHRNALLWMIENKFTFTLSMDGLPGIQGVLRPLKKGSSLSGMLIPEQTARILANNQADFKIRMTLTRENLPFIKQSISYFHDLGARVVHIEPVNLRGSALTNSVERPGPEEFAAGLMEAIEEAAACNMNIINSSYSHFMEPEESYCQTCKEHFIVGVDGDISLCYEATQECEGAIGDMIIGRYSNGQINWKKNAPGRGLWAFSAKEQEECKECFAHFCCGGGCPVRNYTDSGAPFHPEGYFCKVTKKIIPEIIIQLARHSHLI